MASKVIYLEPNVYTRLTVMPFRERTDARAWCTNQVVHFYLQHKMNVYFRNGQHAGLHEVEALTSRAVSPNEASWRELYYAVPNLKIPHRSSSTWYPYSSPRHILHRTRSRRRCLRRPSLTIKTLGEDLQACMEIMLKTMTRRKRQRCWTTAMTKNEMNP